MKRGNKGAVEELLQVLELTQGAMTVIVIQLVPQIFEGVEDVLELRF